MNLQLTQYRKVMTSSHRDNQKHLQKALLHAQFPSIQSLTQNYLICNSLLLVNVVAFLRLN